MLDEVKKINNFLNIKPKEWATFSIFFTISVIMWFFINLSNNYTENIVIKYNYQNLPEDKVVVDGLPKKTEIEVNAKAFELIKYKWFKNIPNITVNIRKDAVIKDNKLTFSSKIIKTLIKEKLGNNINVLNDRLSIRTYTLSTIKRKRLKVLPDINLNFASQYGLMNNINVLPYYVKAYGPKNVIDTLSYAYTVHKDFNRINKSKSVYVKLKKIKTVNFVPDSVKIIIPVDRFTEKTIKVGVNIINKPKNINIELLPAFVNVKFVVSYSNYDKITDKQFKVIADYKNMNKSAINRVEVRLIKHPKDIENIYIYPKKVDFLIKTK